MFKVFILLLTLAGAIEARAWVRVGNGGEGVRVNGVVYLRDLYEVGAHLDPYVEDAISPDILERWNRSPQRAVFRNQEIVLLKKLTELDGILPGLAEILIVGLESYRFIFVDKELPLMPDESSTVPQGGRVSIALRQYSDIVIQRQEWNSLSVVSQTALLIHEIFYALSNVTCPKVGQCFQYSQVIRPLVGDLFKRVKPSQYAETLVKELSLENVYRYCENKSLFVELNVIAVPTGSSSLAYHSENFFPSAPGFLELATAACKSLNGQVSATNLVHTFDHEFLSLGQKVYGTSLQTAGGRMDVQLALVFRRMNRAIKRSFQKIPEKECVQKLSSELSDFRAKVRKDELPFGRMCLR